MEPARVAANLTVAVADQLELMPKRIGRSSVHFHRARQGKTGLNERHAIELLHVHHQLLIPCTFKSACTVGRTKKGFPHEADKLSHRQSRQVFFLPAVKQDVQRLVICGMFAGGF